MLLLDEMVQTFLNSNKACIGWNGVILLQVHTDTY